MNEEKYQKLNYYLNGVFKELENNDAFLLRNILNLARLSDDYVHLTDNYNFKIYNKQNNLTFNDVYLLAREIVEGIDKNYLEYYDKLIENGILDFSYNHEYPVSQFLWNDEKEIRLININRNFNYIDVTSLIHEFMHYMNHIDNKLSNNRYLLTEDISIYFEEYAKRYLIQKGISKEELFLNERIMSTKRTASNFNWYSLIFLAYEKFGNIDNNTYKFLNEYFLSIEKEEFEEECSKALKLCERIHEKYKFEYKMKSEDLNGFEDNLFRKLIEFVNKDYRYILGTYIAYYALEHSSLEKMVYLCNHINEYSYSKMDPIDVLKYANIDIYELDIEIIEKVILENKTKRKEK